MSAAPQQPQIQIQLTPQQREALQKMTPQQQQQALAQLYAAQKAAAAQAAASAAGKAAPSTPTAPGGAAAGGGAANGAAAGAASPVAPGGPAAPASTAAQIHAANQAAHAAAMAAQTQAAKDAASFLPAALPTATPQQQQMAAQWRPRPEGLEKMCALFRETNQSNEQRAKSFQQLQALSAHPEFNNYLAFILSSAKTEPDIVRQRAGLKLKNVIRENYENMLPAAREYVKAHTLMTIGDNNQLVRATVGSIIAMIATKDRLENWPALMPTIVKLLDHQQWSFVDGAWGALTKICEDIPRALDSAALGSPLELLVPKFITTFLVQQEQLRSYAMQSCNQFLYLMPAPLVKHLDKYMASLFALASDPSKAIRKKVCQAFVILQEVRYDCIKPQIANVIRYMIKATEDDDEVVALEACEFWSGYCENKQADLGLLREHLKVLVPILIKRMVYSEMDALILGGDEDDADRADSATDIKPRFHQARVANYGGADTDTFDDDEEASEWNLRKCSAASLDTLAGVFKHELLPVLLPLLQITLSNREDWKIRESGVLALGAVAEGCYRGIEPYLKDLVPYLLELLKDAKPLVRSITCWTLSRYSKWVMREPDDEKYFKPLMIELLRRVLDRNKRVQEAACSAFATLEEEAQDRLVKYLGPVLQNLMYAFSTYQAKNMLILYDAIGTLAEAVGAELNKAEFIQVLMPPLLQRLMKLSEDDRNLFPLLECLTSVVQALGSGFAPYAKPVFGRCLQIIERNILAQQQATQAQQRGIDVDQPDREFVVCALDLLSGMAEALEGNMEALVGQSNLLPLLLHCTRDVDPDVRQSAFALLGDLAKSSIAHLRPHLDKFLPVAWLNLNPKIVAVCNNASWAIGEIAIRAGPETKPFVPNLLNYLVAILLAPNMIPNLLENTAITIGRIAIHCPEVVAPALPKFAHHWCVQLARIRDPAEKDGAFRALCAVIQKNPQGMLAHFPALCNAIASWQPPPAELKRHFQTILASYKTSLAARWGDFFGRCSQPLQKHLSDVYGV